MSARSSNSPENDGVRTRCVILVSPGETPPQPLLDLLRDQARDPRDIETADHPLISLARLATHERARRLRQATLDEWPPPPPEKTMLVVVNREAWRDLSGLFSTIRQLMPAVGIWVCTERIAIEIYAGDGSDRIEPGTDVTDVTLEPEPGPDVGAEAEADADLDAAELTEAELRDLLDMYGGFEDDLADDDPHSNDSGGPDTP